VLRSLQTELKRAGVTANRIRDILFNGAPPSIDASRVGDHTNAAAATVRDAAFTMQLLGIQRLIQARALLGARNVVDPDAAQAKLDLVDAKFGASLDKDVETLAYLLGIASPATGVDAPEPSLAVQNYFARYALGHDGGVEYDFSDRARMNGSKDAAEDWQGDMLTRQQNVLGDVLRSVSIATNDIRRRVIGKCLNFAPPGHLADLLLGNFA
jgi:hypothetical protein